MAGILDKLVYVIGADVDESSFKKAEGSLKGLRSTSALLFTTIASGMAAMIGFTTVMAMSTEKTAAAAKKAKMTYQEYEAIAHAAKDAGMGVNEYIKSLDDLDEAKRKALANYGEISFETEQSIRGAKDYMAAVRELWGVTTSFQKFMAGKFGAAIDDTIRGFSDLIIKNKEFMREGVDAFVEDLAQAFDGLLWVIKQFGSGFKFVIDMLGGPQTAVKLLTSSIKGLAVVLGLLGGFKILKIAAGYVTGLITQFGRLKALLLSIKNIGLVAALMAIFEDIDAWVSGGKSWMGTITGRPFKLWLEDLKAVKEMLVNEDWGFIWDVFWETARDLGIEVLTEWGNWFNSLGDWLNNFIKRMWNAIRDFGSAIVTSAKEKISGAVDTVKDAFGFGDKPQASASLVPTATGVLSTVAPLSAAVQNRSLSVAPVYNNSIYVQGGDNPYGTGQTIGEAINASADASIDNQIARLRNQ